MLSAEDRSFLGAKDLGHFLQQNARREFTVYSMIDWSVYCKCPNAQLPYSSDIIGRWNHYTLQNMWSSGHSIEWWHKCLSFIDLVNIRWCIHVHHWMLTESMNKWQLFQPIQSVVSWLFRKLCLQHSAWKHSIHFHMFYLKCLDHLVFLFIIYQQLQLILTFH